MKSKNTLVLHILVLAAVAFMIQGCNDSGSLPESETSETIEIQTLGHFPRQRPTDLKQSVYRLSPSLSTYATFRLTEASNIGYMISQGTVEIYDSNDAPIHSDIFFPVENDYKIVSLDAGAYLIKIQNSLKEEGAFAIFSGDMGLDHTTIWKSESVLVAEKAHEFIVIEIQRDGVDFRASLPTGKVALFDFNYTELEPPANTVRRNMQMGQYILLADNAASKTYGTLEIEMTDNYEH